ncbi:hypothetical protein ACMHYB_59430 [Sorangium sp. So ce1128]
MKKRGRMGGEQVEKCLLIAESGAPWTECAAPRAPGAHELAGLSLTLRELLGGGAVTVSLEAPRGEPLRHLAAGAAV